MLYYCIKSKQSISIMAEELKKLKEERANLHYQIVNMNVYSLPELNRLIECIRVIDLRVYRLGIEQAKPK